MDSNGIQLQPSVIVVFVCDSVFLFEFSTISILVVVAPPIHQHYVAVRTHSIRVGYRTRRRILFAAEQGANTHDRSGNGQHAKLRAPCQYHDLIYAGRNPTCVSEPLQEIVPWGTCLTKRNWVQPPETDSFSRPVSFS